VRLVFNMLEDDGNLEAEFKPLLSFLDNAPLAKVNAEARLYANEIYGLVNGTGVELAALASDTTDFKKLIAATSDSAQRLALARRLGAHRLACGVLPALDACFAALELLPCPTRLASQAVPSSLP
jgi:hypothetical protein